MSVVKCVSLDLPASRVTIGDITVKFTFQCPSLSELQEKYDIGEYIKSEVQEFGGYKTWFVFYPNGISKESNGYASGYLGIIPPKEKLAELVDDAKISFGCVYKQYSQKITACPILNQKWDFPS